MHLLISLCTIFSLPFLYAEKIGNVEYQIPSIQEWQAAGEMNNEEMKVVLYTPKTLEEGAFEVFSATLFSHSCERFSFEEIKKGLEAAFPNQTVQARELEWIGDSVLYEWSAKEQDETVAFGWGRVFEKEQVLLAYQTNQSDEEGTLWLQVLKNASIHSCSRPDNTKISSTEQLLILHESEL